MTQVTNSPNLKNKSVIELTFSYKTYILVVIKLEGGSDQDVKKLLDGVTDEPEVKEIKPESSPKHSPKTEETDLDKKENDSKEPSDANESTEPGETTETGSNKRKSAEDSGSESGAYSDSDGEEKPNEHKKRNQIPMAQINPH